MKRLLNLFLLAVILPAFVITGCKDKTAEPAEKGNIETLKAYMISEGYDLPALLDGWVIAPAMIADGGIVDTDYSIPDYVVFDIRGEADFNAGHIKDAINVALTDVVTKAKEIGNEKPFLVVCKSGQTAGRATMALRLSGFDAKVMKFGMSYWNAEFDVWTGNIGDNAVGSANWVNDASATLPVNAFPAWESTSTDGAAILAERIDAMLAADWAQASDAVLADPAGFNIYNFWTVDEYTSLGHFDGAYQYKPISLDGDLVTALPSSDLCLVYCFTGQTSSYITAWLQVLGYNAKSILYGVNKLQHTALDAAGKPAWHHSNDYEYVIEN